MAQAYAIESAFFDVCPTKFFDEVYELVDRLINEGVEALEERIADEVDEGEKEAVRKACNKFLNMFQAASDNNLDKMEMYSLLNIFNVPPAVYREWCSRQRISSGSPAPPEIASGAGQAGAAGGRRAVTAVAEADMDSKLKHARKSLRSAKRRQASLLARRRDLAAAHAQLDTEAKKALEAFGAATGANGEPPLGTDAKHLNAMVEKIAARASSVNQLLHNANQLLDTVLSKEAETSAASASAPASAELGAGEGLPGGGGGGSGDEGVQKAVAAFHAAKRTLAQTTTTATAVGGAGGAVTGDGSSSRSSAAQLRRLAQRLA